VVRALASLLQGRDHFGETYNLGSNHPIAIEDLARRIRDLTGARSRVVNIPHEVALGRGFEEPSERVPDLSKVGRALGFAPRLGLDRILADVVASYRDRLPGTQAGSDGRDHMR
jgi:UDP-glucose 4-epimerase